MALTEGPIVVCDAGPIIHLDEMDCLGLLVAAGAEKGARSAELAR